MKKIFGFIKKNIVACVCLFLALAVFLTGTISFSKYISTDTENKLSAAGSFSCSGAVDSVSSLSFANADFWSTTGDGDIAMNTVHTINFAVNNYQENKDEEGNTVSKTVSAVKMRYTLVFTAPIVFADRIAFQIFENYGTPLLPQIVIDDLFEKAGSTYDTAQSKDYQEEPFGDMQFNVTKSSASLEGESFDNYTATAPLSDGSGDVVIKFEPVLSELNQILKFRLWDVSELGYTTENPAPTDGGNLLAPVIAEITSKVPCYRISISMPKFIFGAGAEEQSKYSIRFAPTTMLDDYQLCGALCKEDGSVLQSLYAGQPVTVNTLEETITDTDDNGNEIYQNSYYVYGNPRVYVAGDTEILSESTTTDTTTTTTTQESTVISTKNYIYFDQNWKNVTSDDNSRYYAVNASKLTISVVTTTTTTTTTNVTETAKTDSVTSEDGNETVRLTITRTTKTNTVTSTRTTTENKIADDDYISDTFYIRSGNKWEQQSGVVAKDRLGNPEAIETTSTPTNNTVTETYTRTIERVRASSAPIMFDKVYSEAEDGQIINYDSADKALQLFQDDGKQLYFLSQCYSKSYPISVNVIFEQIQS